MTKPRDVIAMQTEIERLRAALTAYYDAENSEEFEEADEMARKILGRTI